MSIDELRALGALGTGLLVGVLTLLTWVARRQTRDAREARKTVEINKAALRWKNAAETLAAVRGWDQDPHWPLTPKELTLEYLMDQTDDPAGPIAQLAESVRDITGKGKP